MKGENMIDNFSKNLWKHIIDTIENENKYKNMINVCINCGLDTLFGVWDLYEEYKFNFCNLQSCHFYKRV